MPTASSAPCASWSRRAWSDAMPASTRPAPKHVLVLADAQKAPVRVLLAELERWLAGRVAKVEVDPDARGFAKRIAEGASAPKPDLLIVLGGDGAILGAVRAFARAPVPTLGINFGRVGFLAAAEEAHWREALEAVLAGRAQIEQRLRLQADLHAAGSEVVRAIALNDVVLTRGAFQGMLELALSVGGRWVTNYRADGLIVSTPSGSTAYSMAAGGAILDPALDGIVITPICPQALSHRPLVLTGGSELELTLTRSSGITTLVVDGQGFFPVHEGDTVRLCRHPKPYPLIVPPGPDFYPRLRDRLGWRGTFESEGPHEDPTDGRSAGSSGSVL
jgi:NAD+ kinase